MLYYKMTKRMRRKSSMRKKSTLRRTNMIHGGNKKKKFIRDLGKSLRKKTVKKKKVKKKMEDHSKQSADLKKEPKKARSRKKSSRRRRNKPKRNTSSSGEYGDRGGLTPIDDRSMSIPLEINDYVDNMDEIGQHKKADLARKLLLDTQPSNSRKSRRSTPPRPSNLSKSRRYTPPRPSNFSKSRRRMSPVPYNSQELDPWSGPVRAPFARASKEYMRKLQESGTYAQFVNLTEAIKYTERKEKELKRSWWESDRKVDDVMLGRVNHKDVEVILKDLRKKFKVELRYKNKVKLLNKELAKLELELGKTSVYESISKQKGNRRDEERFARRRGEIIRRIFDNIFKKRGVGEWGELGPVRIPIQSPLSFDTDPMKDRILKLKFEGQQIWKDELRGEHRTELHDPMKSIRWGSD